MKQAVENNWIFWICLTVSIILILGGALTPPPFVIDNSIFIAVGELFGFAALGAFIKALDAGFTTKIKKGDTHLEIIKKDEN